MAQDLSTLPALAASTFVAVGPSRIAALTLLLLDRQPDCPDAKRHAATAAERLETAHIALAKDMPDGLLACGYAPSAELEAARSDALAMIGQLYPAPKRRGDVMTLDFCLDKFETTVTAFLTLMRAELAGAHDAWLSKEREEALTAVKAVDTVGRSIRMIAFNASIEAARVGDQGRGFMVIADEVSKLAARTEALLGEVYRHLRSG